MHGERPSMEPALQGPLPRKGGAPAHWAWWPAHAPDRVTGTTIINIDCLDHVDLLAVFDLLYKTTLHVI